MIYHVPEALVSRGFKPITVGLAQMPSLSRLQTAARDSNVTLSSVTAFRVTGGLWNIYLRPGAQPGYIEEALLS